MCVVLFCIFPNKYRIQQFLWKTIAFRAHMEYNSKQYNTNELKQILTCIDELNINESQLTWATN